MERTEGAFAALSNDGKVFAWGHKDFGGRLLDGKEFLTGVETAPSSGLKKSDRAFAVLFTDGTVTAWGDPNYGGYIPPNTQN
jgi:alpha-tubulin suppressor-like RCC1 family protein